MNLDQVKKKKAAWRCSEFKFCHFPAGWSRHLTSPSDSASFLQPVGLEELPPPPALALTQRAKEAASAKMSCKIVHSYLGDERWFLVAHSAGWRSFVCSQHLYTFFPPPPTPAPRQENAAPTWWAQLFLNTLYKEIWIPLGPAPLHFHTQWMTRLLQHSSEPFQTFPPDQES